jgi:murein DD-endopeptidase MepM/ murein hydrolase activator NlpD
VSVRKIVVRPGVAALIAALVAALALIWSVPAGADPHDDKVRVDHELARTHAQLEVATDRVAAAAAGYAEASRRLPAVQRQLAVAQGVLAGAMAKARAAAHGADVGRAAALAAGARFNVAQLAVDQARADFGRYAADLYRGRDIEAAGAVISAGDAGNALLAISYLQQIGRQEQAALDRVTTARLAAKVRQNAALRALIVAEQAKQAARRAVAAAATAKAGADRAAAAVRALIRARAHALAVAAATRAQMLNRYRALQQESARISAEIRGLARGGSIMLPSGLRLIMPTHGWKSSDFGMRYDPFYRVWQLHAGTDFATGTGSPIWAALPGRVFQAGWDGGYGNYTCIYHGRYQGKGFATCYAHQSEILVHVGQEVYQGELIGRVGSSGASTGSHLHFEVRLDGTPVNPLPWLPACLC